MNKLLLALFLAAFSITPTYAQLAPPSSSAATAPRSTEPDEADLKTHDHYVNKDGQAVHSPAKSVDGKVPSGASAKCRDASYSFSKHHSGTCSHHGGVAAWLK
jgi:hypothetical protein